MIAAGSCCNCCMAKRHCQWIVDSTMGCDRVMRSKEEQDEGEVNKGLLGWKSLESEPVGLTCHDP